MDDTTRDDDRYEHGKDQGYSAAMGRLQREAERQRKEARAHNTRARQFEAAGKFLRKAHAEND